MCNDPPARYTGVSAFCCKAFPFRPTTAYIHPQGLAMLPIRYVFDGSIALACLTLLGLALCSPL
jgi:hypothetical protein